MAEQQKTLEPLKSESITRSDSQQGTLRKTYFRLREIKQAGTPVKIIAMSSPKRPLDFYSHQKATIQQFKPKERKMSSTASNFYNNLSRIGKLVGNDQGSKSPLSQMRKTFFNQRSNPENSPQKPNSDPPLFGRTSLNFHKQDIFKNENNNNYLNKYQIIKELGKGSFSIVFLAKKQTNIKKNQRCNSQLATNLDLATNDLSSSDPQNSANLSSFKKNESLNQKSLFSNDKPKEGLPRLSQQQNKQSLSLQEEGSDLVAIKVYEKFKMNKDPHKFKNIRKEINIMQNLQNEGVVKLLESVETLTKISLVVEYGGKESLLEYVKHNYPLPMDTVKDISYQLIKAIAYLHDKNIVHRDIKLQNVLIHESKIKLIDFGFSCLTHKQQKLTVICGTPNYMAPEVISRKEYIGEQADVWSYGVVVYALAQGRHPFKAQTYNQLQRLVNRGKFQFKKIKQQSFINFIRRILKVKASDRPIAKQIMEMRWFKQTEN